MSVVGHKYPKKHDLAEALSTYCSRRFVDRFAAARGIFITKANVEEVSDHLASFFYEFSDLEEIRTRAFFAESALSLTGFIVAGEANLNLPQVMETLRANTDLAKGTVMNALTATGSEEEGLTYKGDFTYVDRKPGKIEFLEEQTRKLTYSMKKLEEGKYQVFVESDRANDGKNFEKFIRRYGPKGIDLQTLADDKLSPANTIAFFDRLGNLGLGDEWRLLDAKQLKLKRSNETDDEDVVETEDEENAVDAEQEVVLTGIKQAMLDGDNLRENEFVKKAEASGYRFSEAAFEYENVEHPYKIILKASFKSNPKVFEVRVIGYFEIQGPDATPVKAVLLAAENITIKTRYWNKAREIYFELAPPAAIA